MTAPAGASRVAPIAFALTFLLLLANGRAIGSGDTNAMERTAAALVERGTVVLPEDGTADPFTRPVSGGRVSIYPVLPALVAAPFFFLWSLFFDLNPAGLQAAGKITAAFLAAWATGLLARSFARRASFGTALGSALIFGLGTSVYSTSQALWQHPVAVLFLVLALDALDTVVSAAPAARRAAVVAGVCLALAAASRPAAIPMCATLFVFLLIHARADAVRIVAAAAVPAIGLASYNAAFFGAPWRFGPLGASGRFLGAFPESVAGLVISPARGLLVFTPIAIVCFLALASRVRVSSMARGVMGAACVHLLFISLWNEWHGGESFGPRLLTDLLPALCFYLPEGLSAWPKAGTALGALSIAIQFLGGFTYDYRWERLHQRGREFDSALWSWRDSPIAFALREGVVIQGAPDLDGRRLRLRVSRSRPFGPQGSIIEAGLQGLRTSGPPLVRDIRLERGARLTDRGAALSHPADALAFRVLVPGMRSVRLIGALDGTLRIETSAGGSTSIPTSGDFDVTVQVQAAAGEEVFVRAETGDLRLRRVEAEGGLSP